MIIITNILTLIVPRYPILQLNIKTLCLQEANGYDILEIAILFLYYFLFLDNKLTTSF